MVFGGEGGKGQQPLAEASAEKGGRCAEGQTANRFKTHPFGHIKYLKGEKCVEAQNTHQFVWICSIFVFTEGRPTKINIPARSQILFLYI